MTRTFFYAHPSPLTADVVVVVAVAAVAVATADSIYSFIRWQSSRANLMMAAFA